MDDFVECGETTAESQTQNLIEWTRLVFIYMHMPKRVGVKPDFPSRRRAASPRANPVPLGLTHCHVAGSFCVRACVLACLWLCLSSAPTGVSRLARSVRSPPGCPGSPGSSSISFGGWVERTERNEKGWSASKVPCQMPRTTNATRNSIWPSVEH